jgi:hypothetical protein
MISINQICRISTCKSMRKWTSIEKPPDQALMNMLMVEQPKILDSVDWARNYHPEKAPADKPYPWTKDESPQTFEGFPCQPEKMPEDEMMGGQI